MATCCCASSSHGRLLTFSSSSRSPARLRLICPSAPLRLRLSSSSSSSSSSSRAPHPQRLSCSSSQEPAPVDVADDDCSAADQRIGFEIQVSKIGKRNRRLVRARVRVDAPLEAVWATLTDYEGLADFIPGLSECRLLDQAQGFARLYQVGEQDLALGFKFNAKGTIDCYEGDLESLPDAQGNARRREIAFNMIDGDFKVFQGKWSVQEVACYFLNPMHSIQSICLLIVWSKSKVEEIQMRVRNPRRRHCPTWLSWSPSCGFRSGYSKEGSAVRSRTTLFP
ncbi:hypothetical protein SETIT_5G468000v2 [Setaria italica]|uniref:Coenzyme Q-binding protein COQ10 START domain-containing protein n=1 Tax=Setaria italica TaxID=4555 RepID=A0A368RGP9_SETIT|nr:hypothetical protein SETIT_5G468000v2 [Setaria italica]